VKLVLIPGAVHGGKIFYDAEHLVIMKEFLESIPTK
jgi:hypothetical protein